MLTVVIKDSGERNVIALTYENLWRELKDIPKSKLLVSENWFDTLDDIKSTFVCLVEPDCLVNSGYFSSQLGLIQKNPRFRKLSMLSSSTAVNHWVNRFYGYSLDNGYTDAVVPNREKKSRGLYPVQVGYAPGAIIRMSMINRIKDYLQETPGLQDDLVALSAKLSFEFWGQGGGDAPNTFAGNPVYINPNTTYVTTEDYVNDINQVDVNTDGLLELFKRESI